MNLEKDAKISKRLRELIGLEEGEVKEMLKYIDTLPDETTLISHLFVYFTSNLCRIYSVLLRILLI